MEIYIYSLKYLNFYPTEWWYWWCESCDRLVYHCSGVARLSASKTCQET